VVSRPTIGNMALTNCPIHGFQGGMTLIDPAIIKLIEADVHIDEREVVVIEADFYIRGGELLDSESYLVTKKDFEELHLKSHYEIHEESNDYLIKPVEDIVTPGIICVQCFREYMKKHNWEFDFPRPSRGLLAPR
jgi:hypothetical protein